MDTSRRIARFRSLDILRALVALGVVLYHCSTTLLPLPAGMLGDMFLHGVSIFFAISGYCIFVTTRCTQASVSTFLLRRWRRIYLPYWASIVLALGVALVVLPFNRGRVEDLLFPSGAWLSFLTLTQGFTPYRDAINTVYWTLGLEEQFYLVMAAALLVRERHRPLMIGAVSSVAALYVAVFPEYQIPGLFLSHWLSFATGAAAAIWLHDPLNRGWAAAVALLAAGSSAATSNVSLAIAMGAAFLMVAIWRLDDRIAGAAVARPLIAVGMFSYSLYLVHVPIGGRVVNLLNRFESPVVVTLLVATAVSLAAGYGFHLLVERPVWTRPAWFGVKVFHFPPPPVSLRVRESGGTGRRARLRIWYP